eukprot:scaffold101287_cov19-Tisochrysis_lutea.AAC.1
MACQLQQVALCVILVVERRMCEALEKDVRSLVAALLGMACCVADQFLEKSLRSMCASKDEGEHVPRPWRLSVTDAGHRWQDPCVPCMCASGH